MVSFEKRFDLGVWLTFFILVVLLLWALSYPIENTPLSFGSSLEAGAPNQRVIIEYVKIANDGELNVVIGNKGRYVMDRYIYVKGQLQIIIDVGNNESMYLVTNTYRDVVELHLRSLEDLN